MIMIKTFNNKKGMTLIELLLAIVIAAIIFGVAFSLQFFGLQSFNIGTSRAYIQQDARLADEIIRRELRNATSFSGSRTISFDGETLSYGENSQVQVEKINTIRLEKDGQLLNITITGDDYELENQILLNNVDPEGDDNFTREWPDDGSLEYLLPGDE